MTLSREEMALALYPTLLTTYAHDSEAAARRAVQHADALLLALTPTPAPVAPPAGKYEPRVGDVVAHVEYPGEEFTVQSIDGCGVTTQRTDAGIKYDTEGTSGSPDNLRYLRDSTAAEKRAAGLAVPPPAPTPAGKRAASRGWTDEQMAAHRAEFERWARGLDMNTRRADKGSGYDDPLTDGAWLAWEDRVPFSATPAPEAKRPTHVRITKSASPSRFKDGDVLRVVDWIAGEPAVYVDGYDVAGYVLYDSKWEPAPCPPPVAGRVEKDALRDAESQVIEAAIRWRAAYCGGAGDYINDAADERVALDSAVANLATLRSALSRPVRP